MSQEVLKAVEDDKAARELLDMLAVNAEDGTAFGAGCREGIAESRRFVEY